jgi:outer membrane protein assembly factor BamB
MSTHSSRRAVALVVLAARFAVHAVFGMEQAADWPAFQGPRGDGSSPETGLLRSWPQDGPPVVWRAKIGQGWGQPAVVGDSIYLSWSADLHGNGEVAACFAAKDGAERWRCAYETPPYWKRNIGWAKGGVRATPCVDGGRVFTLGPGGDLHGLDGATGRVLWAQDVYKRWSPSGEKGYCFSPLVVDGKLILWFGDSSYAMDDADKKLQLVCEALDPATGKVLWTFQEPHLATSQLGGGQTPAVTTIAGERCVLITANCQLKALRVSDGREVWKFDCIRPGLRSTTIPTPLVLGRRILNLPDNDFMHVVDFDRETPGATARIVWKKDQTTYTSIHQFREQGGFLYGFTGAQPGDSDVIASGAHLTLTCIDLATGDVRWREPGFRTGTSHLLADGLLFVRCYQTLRLVEATPEGYRQRGEVHTHDVWKPTVNLTDIVCPVLARGRLYVRTPEELVCYDVAAH